jgi:hypothetical protein
MKIEFMWKDAGSNTGNCPAIYKAEGGYVVQGRLLDAATTAQLRDLGDGEGGLFIPANVLDRLAEQG